MASVDLRGVRKSFGSVDVIHDINLSIADGAFVALVGPSGCGKSTLLRMIAGLEETTDGDIAIGNTVVNDLTPRERNIAMVFQNYALYPHMTVRENMGFNLKLAGKKPAEIEARVGEAARMLGLQPLLDRRPSQLSGGQRQRVAMGRAIVRHPQVFLFDEPLSNLDAQLRVQMRTEIRDLQRRLNVTSIYVTHDQVEAMTMADKIVIMNAGVVEQIGSPLEVYDFPRNKFVAGFIGSPQMNFVDGTAAADKPLFRAAAGLELPLGASHTVSPGRAVTYGIRPEHISIGTEGTEAIVHLVENTGHETLVHFEAQDVRLAALMTERPWFKEGETIRFSLDGAHAHLFDAKTGFTIAGAGAAS